VRPEYSRYLVLGTIIWAIQAAGVPGAVGATPAPLDSALVGRIVAEGVASGAYPGAAVAIGRRDTVLLLRGYGRLDWARGSPAVDPSRTRYDLASLTKVVVTTTAVMMLVDEAKLRLDDPAATYIPEFDGPGTAGITVRQLLTHTSGLRADLPAEQVRGAPDATALLGLMYAERPRSTPGSRVVYSDINAVLLGEIVRRVSGEPIDRFAARRILGPLGMGATGYRPVAREREDVAPTGRWRGRPVAGRVNDPTAAKLGGVAGNAGLFATASDLARFAQFMLRGGVAADGTRLVRSQTVREFTTRAVNLGQGEARALGWQALPTGERVSSAGSRFGPRSYGHTGWTGTSLWIDPERDLFVVLLTNRADAPRSPRSFTVVKEIRGRIADAAADAVDDGRAP
jgi:CubicO group peptidase (beta-lactamase class C family)